MRIKMELVISDRRHLGEYMFMINLWKIITING